MKVNNIFENANIAAFKSERYVDNIWKIFICADIMNGALIDLESQMKGLGDYRLDDKRNMKNAIFSSFKVIEGIGKVCNEDFNNKFGDISDEVRTMITSYITNKHAKEFIERPVKINDFYKKDK